MPAFKGANWALVLGLPLRDTIKGLLLVPNPILIPKFGLVSWACAPIISNPINYYFGYMVHIILFGFVSTSKQFISFQFTLF